MSGLPLYLQWQYKHIAHLLRLQNVLQPGKSLETPKICRWENGSFTKLFIFAVHFWLLIISLRSKRQGTSGCKISPAAIFSPPASLLPMPYCRFRAPPGRLLSQLSKVNTAGCSQKGDGKMNYFDTVAGQNFTQYTVPELVSAIEKLTKELKRANDLEEKKQEEKNHE